MTKLETTDLIQIVCLDVALDESILMVTTGWNGFYEIGNTETFVVPATYAYSQQSLSICQPLPHQTQTMHALSMATGGLLKANSKLSNQHLPVVCGGSRNHEPNEKCYLLDDSSGSYLPTVIGVMTEMREGAASVTILDGNILWVTGGEFAVVSETTEWINSSMAETGSAEALIKGIPLPMPMSYHCLEMINGNAAILYGGNPGFGELGYHSTFTISDLNELPTMEKHQWTPRAPMSIGRMKHSCGVIREDISDRTNSRKYVVAAGGADHPDDIRYSVELLSIDEDSAGNITVSDFWQEGPRMPQSLVGGASATTPDQTTLFVVGGMLFSEPYYQDLSEIFTFRCAIGECWWRTDSATELIVGRTHPVAMIIPPTNQNFTGK